MTHFCSFCGDCIKKTDNYVIGVFSPNKPIYCEFCANLKRFVYMNKKEDINELTKQHFNFNLIDNNDDNNFKKIFDNLFIHTNDIKDTFNQLNYII